MGSPSTSPASPGRRPRLPHGSPGDRPIVAGQVLLFDFGAQVDGYRSDMTRTLFVGEPALATWRSTSSWPKRRRPRSRRSRRPSELAGRCRADGRPTRSPATSSRPPATATTSATGPVTGSAWRPTSCRASGSGRRDAPLPTPTVFSVEPGVYLDGETGVRIEDLLVVDSAAGRCERLTGVPARDRRRRRS